MIGPARDPGAPPAAHIAACLAREPKRAGMGGSIGLLGFSKCKTSDDITGLGVKTPRPQDVPGLRAALIVLAVAVAVRLLLGPARLARRRAGRPPASIGA